jgi:phospholipid-translocating ATPase
MVDCYLSQTSANVSTVFPVFGASSPQVAALPLLFILTVTAIKDGVEDYRRAAHDEEVNTSAVTKLGQWRNVNQPSDPRSLFQKLLGINPPGSVSKGVRKLREKETAEGMRIMLTKTSDDQISTRDVNDSSLSLSGQPMGSSGRTLDDIQSVDSHSYPPTTSNDFSKASLETTVPAKTPADWGQFGSISTYQQSVNSQSTVGVVDWQKRATGSPRWERTLWKKLEVGDIVLLHNNEQVPADIVLLSTSDPDGMCYLETKNLDGETNLKPRKSIRATSSMKSEEDIERSSFYLDSEPPHQNLYVYHGVLKFADPTTGEEKQNAVTINELLLRGCAIRNTSWVIGLVVFTGADTKIVLNGGATPSKRSKIEKETNFNVIVNFVVLILMCLFSAIFSGLEDSRTGTSADYFEPGALASNQAVLQALITFVYVIALIMMTTSHLTIIYAQIVSHCLPEHCAHFAVYLHRDRQNHSGVLHFAGYRHVLSCPQYAMCPQDVEYLRRSRANRIRILRQDRYADSEHHGVPAMLR